MNDFLRNVRLLDRALSANTLRYQVAANNLANAEVPNFKRSDVNFESQLARAIEAQKKTGRFEMTATHPLHLHSDAPPDPASIKPRISTDYFTAAKANGNNVNAEEEAMNVMKIQMNYQLLSKIQAFNFSQLKLVIK